MVKKQETWLGPPAVTVAVPAEAVAEGIDKKGNWIWRKLKHTTEEAAAYAKFKKKMAKADSKEKWTWK